MDAINMACYIMNRAPSRPILSKTPYEFYFGRKLNISHINIFGCKCYVHNNSKDNLDKFDSKFDEAWFIGYSSSMHVVFDEFFSSGDRLIKDKDQGDWINIHTQSSPENAFK